jgi:hypothetical protein
MCLTSASPSSTWRARPGRFEDRAGPTVVLDQKNENFVPHILAITVGTSVEFLNSDRTYHNVFSLSKANSFDLGRYPPGGPRPCASTIRNRARVLRDPFAHERVHPRVRPPPLRGHGPARGVPDRRVPPGAYTVSVWHPTFTAKSESVRVPEQGGEVEASFVLS